jgi:hypothetical protein
MIDMGKKKYTSYNEIDADLQILKVQKELDYYKLKRSIENSKNLFSRENLFSEVSTSFKSYVSGSVGSIIKNLLPWFISWILNKKKR